MNDLLGFSKTYSKRIEYAAATRDTQATLSESAALQAVKMVHKAKSMEISPRTIERPFASFNTRGRRHRMIGPGGVSDSGRSSKTQSWPLRLNYSSDALVIDEKHDGRPSESAKRPNGERPSFKPSPELLSYVMKGAQSIAREQAVEIDASPAQASEQIQLALSGLLYTMSDSLRDAGDTSDFELGSDGQFDEAVALALLCRVAVGLYDSLAFLSLFYSELLFAVRREPLRSFDWILVASSREGLVLRPLGSRALVVSRFAEERASVYRPAA